MRRTLARGPVQSEPCPVPFAVFFVETTGLPLLGEQCLLGILGWTAQRGRSSSELSAGRAGSGQGVTITRTPAGALWAAESAASTS